jgi:hypothetical protein
MPPVTVLERRSEKRTLTDVESASLFLLQRWPYEFSKTDLHVLAQILAVSALDSNRPAEEFRAAFVEAAAEADILSLEHDPPPLLKDFMAKLGG